MAVTAERSVTLLPYADFLGIEVVGEEQGAPLLHMSYAEGLGGAPGLLHGGAIAGLLEIAAVAAVDAAHPGEADARARFKPVTVTVDFMRPGRPCDSFACGRVVRIGNRIAHVEVKAWQDDPDRPIAAARMTVAVRPKEDK
jgi:uncharacterized protein (TIGR00369 family)